MVTKLEDVNFGMVICDMHDGLELPDGWSVVDSIRVHCSGGCKFIENAVKHNGGDLRYTNKELAIVDEWADERGSGVIAMYSWDDSFIVTYRIRIGEAPTTKGRLLQKFGKDGADLIEEVIRHQVDIITDSDWFADKVREAGK